MEFTIITVETDIKQIETLLKGVQPKTVIFITPHKNDEKVKETSNFIANTFGRQIQIKKTFIDKNDIIENSKTITEIVDKEHSLGKEVIMHITEHSEYSFCLSYGAYSRFKIVKRIVAINRKGGIVDLPVLRYHLTKNKIKILKQLTNENKTLQTLSNELNLSEGMIYHHIRELRNLNLIQKNKLKITTAGKLAIL